MVVVVVVVLGVLGVWGGGRAVPCFGASVSISKFAEPCCEVLGYLEQRCGLEEQLQVP